MVTIQITEEQQGFLIEAAEEKFKKLMTALNNPRNRFVLSAERVRIIKDLGLWENEMYRSWAIKAFVESDQNADDRETLAVIKHRVQMLEDERKEQEREEQEAKQPVEEVKPVEPPKKVAKKAPKKALKNVGAPWGLKKDGTPKKRPGRPKRTEQ